MTPAVWQTSNEQHKVAMASTKAREQLKVDVLKSDEKHISDTRRKRDSGCREQRGQEEMTEIDQAKNTVRRTPKPSWLPTALPAVQAQGGNSTTTRNTQPTVEVKLFTQFIFIS